MIRSGARAIEHRRTRLSAAARGLPRPQELLGLATQRLDAAAGRLGAGLLRNVAVHAHALAAPASALKPALLQRPLAEKRARLGEFADRLHPILIRRLQREGERLASVERQRLSLNPEGPLTRGYALVRSADGTLARSARALVTGETVSLKFADGDRAAVVDGVGGASRPGPPSRPAARSRPAPASSDQGDLF